MPKLPDVWLVDDRLIIKGPDCDLFEEVHFDTWGAVVAGTPLDRLPVGAVQLRRANDVD